MANIYNWSKSGKNYTLSLDGADKASLSRKNIFSAEAEGKAGKNQFLFKPDGRFDKMMNIFDGSTEKKLGHLNFRWVDFQKSTLKLENGKSYTLRSHEILKGAWAWYEADKPNPAMVFRVDTPFHRSGTVELGEGKLTAADRDLLMNLGLLMQLFVNTWMIIAIIVVIAAVT